MKHVNVLVFPCGSEVGLEINRALKDISFITLFGASSVADHGKYVFENYIEGLPFITDPDFFPALNAVLQEYEIDYLYPAMDQVIDVLSANRSALAAELVAPEHETVHICRNKQRTYDRLAGLDFVPVTYESAAEVERYPVIIKPEEGYGARGFQILRTRADLEYALASADVPMVICEYLSGEEYTIDCFTDRHGALKFVSCRNRNRIRNGISVNSRLQPNDPEIEAIARAISERIPMRGAWFFQLKRNDLGRYKLLEAATRIAGTMCLERAIGVDLPLLSVFDMMGYDVEIDPQLETAEVDRALYNAYRLDLPISEVYVDFDDTMVVHGKVNTNLMRFLYQCVNERIPLHLITKHDTDIYTDLKKYRLPAELFDEIIRISHQQRKCDFIHPDEHALFIDDSFAERREIREHFGIYTFGTESVECLIDHRH